MLVLCLMQVAIACASNSDRFGAYLRAPGGIRHGTGLFVLTLTGDRICAMTRFENSVLPSFGLPRSWFASGSWDKSLRIWQIIT